MCCNVEQEKHDVVCSQSAKACSTLDGSRVTPSRNVFGLPWIDAASYVDTSAVPEGEETRAARSLQAENGFQDSAETPE